MSQTITDHDAVARLVQLYIEGAAGDVDKLKQAFHPDAMMFGQLGSEVRAIPFRQFIESVGNAKRVLCGPNYQARIMSIQVIGDAGVAALAEEDYIGLDFVDYFSVAKLEGRWWIVNKTFAVTGGNAPA